MVIAMSPRNRSAARRVRLDIVSKKTTSIDEFQINEINVDLRTSGFDNEVLSVDACAV